MKRLIPFVGKVEKIRKIFISDYIFYPFLCVLIILIGQLPIFLHVLNTPKDAYFPLLDKISFSDYYYPALVKFGMGPDWLVQIPYVILQHKGSLIQVFFLFLGKLALLFGTNPFVMIALWRILGGGIYLLSAYVLFRIVVPIRFRKVVFLLFLCAQPLSTFTVDLLKDHYEVWVWHFGEAARRISAMPPHYTVGKGLTVLSIGMFLTYFAKKKPIILFASCISGFVAGLIYPPPVFILISSMVLGTVVYGGVHWKEKKEMSEFILKNAFPIGIFFLFVCMPLGLLKLELSKGYPWNLWNKVELGWNDPKMMFELDYARQLGLLLGLVPFAFISLFLKKNNRSWYECFVFIWSISAFLFFPFANALQLGKFRFTEGAQIIPLAIVALWGSEYLFRKSIKLKKVALSLFIFYFGVFTFLVARDSTIALNGYWRNVYIQPEELSVLNYLDSHATKDTIIVADVFSANYIPAFARVKTTTGFPDFFESYEKFLRIYQLTDKFFLRELTDTQAYELLKEQKADYVYYLNYVYGDVTIYPSFLEKVNGNSGIVLYKVKKSL